MKFYILSLILNLGLIFALSEFSNANGNTVTGQWKTIDDETGAPKSIVEIKEENGQLIGKVIQLFKKPEEDQNPKCDKCSGDKKDQPVIGMTILWDMKKKAIQNGMTELSLILKKGNPTVAK